MNGEGEDNWWWVGWSCENNKISNGPQDKSPDTSRALRDFRNLIKSRRRYAVTNEQYYRESGPINCGTVRICIFAKVTYATG